MSWSNLCPICDGSRWAKYAQVNGYSLQQCTVCELVTTQPLPSAGELAAFYGRPDFYAKARGHIEQARDDARRRLHWISRCRPSTLPSARLVEVGCATGEFLALAQEAGWDVEGVELSPAMAQEAHERTGAPVHAGFLEDFVDLRECKESGYDVVVAWEVVEHTLDPAAFLNRLAALLRPGGLLGLSSPNIAGWQARVLAERFPMLIPPEHLYYFSLKSFRHWAGRVGLELRGHTSVSGLRPLTVQRGLDRFLWRRAPSERLRPSGRLAHALLSGPFALLDACGWGTQLEVYFAKPT